jgi:hypothetical protein
MCVAAAVLSAAHSRSAKQKLERIEAGKLRPGETVVLTEDEINSYLRYDYAAEIPAGLSDPHLRGEAGRVHGDLLVDFVEWRSARGESPGPLVAWLLRGKRRVEVTARWRSGNGRGQVDIESVRIGGVPISPALVTWLIENVVQPRYPEVVVGQPVELGYSLREVRIEPGRAVLVAGPSLQASGSTQGAR